MWNFNQLLVYRNMLTSGSMRTERQLVSAAAIAAQGPTIPGSLPLGNVRAPNLSLEVLVALDRQGALPTGVQPSPVDTVDAATQLQVAITGAPLFATTGAQLTVPAAGYRKERLPGRCTVATAIGVADAQAVTIDVTAPSSILVTPPTGVRATMVLALVLSGVRGSPTLLTVGDHPSWLDMAASPAAVELSALPAGTSLRACA